MISANDSGNIKGAKY